MEFSQYIPWLISLGGFIVAVVTLSRNGRKDRKAEFVEEFTKIHDIEQSLVRVNTKLDQLCTLTTETRAEIKSMNSGIHELDKRITSLENTQETMWRRIDELKAKIGHYHEGE